ncbi:GNAT family N-acetyltransferase [Ochrobactrum sp. P6BS-III]|uniref:GNAT family N-acetyltransferase n=1 Tax=unclassified Ochrobactrum TaxID=239106 RepID=UPI00099360E9|nr:ribosomal protein S18 acetylase RimI-like enzyme [Ochrobactrum sp. P6BSIII]OOL14974.1 GNAT family N-acetyltransferase [Ochrobactrum sp. P6BS-III]
MQFIIRQATPSDMPRITHVRTSVRENHLSVEQMADMGITEASVSEMILASLCCWVALYDNEIVGFSMIDNAEGSLFAAFVLPGHEGKGIGKRLVQIAEQELFKRHALIWLETGASTRAAGFYRSMGWGNDKTVGPDYIRLEKRRASEGGLS